MKTFYKNTWMGLACFIAVWGCSKKPTDYQSFLGGHEITYPGKIVNPNVFTGNLRLLLTWTPSPDPSVAKYVVYWNNNADSVVVNATSHTNTDTVKCLIRNLSEYAYTFFIYSYDNSGNRSVVTEIDNARSYGPIYQSTLHNRLPDPNTPFQVNADGSVILTFTRPDTVNITTKLNYTDSTGKSGTAYISPDSSTVRLPSYKPGAPVLYQSSFIPMKGALDTFLTLKADTFPQIFILVQCAKSLFNQMQLPGDVGTYNSSTSVSNLWNGSVGPQGYPNIFHSDGSYNMPQAFSFDMGKIYPKLAVIEETGRNCCNNPDDFEVWGIADTTGAVQSMLTQDPAWKADAIAKGWTLLTEAHRSDDGQQAMKFNFIPNPPPVRFIRIRVLHVTTGSTNATNISQMTFWNKQ